VLSGIFGFSMGTTPFFITLLSVMVLFSHEVRKVFLPCIIHHTHDQAHAKQSKSLFMHDHCIDRLTTSILAHIGLSLALFLCHVHGLPNVCKEPPSPKHVPSTQLLFFIIFGF
jgi:hypothetical protein